MKRVLAAGLMLAGMATSGAAQDNVTVSQLTAQGKVLLSSHFIEVTEQVYLVMGTVEGGPEFICMTRYRDGSSYDFCRKFK